MIHGLLLTDSSIRDAGDIAEVCGDGGVEAVLSEYYVQLDNATIDKSQACRSTPVSPPLI